MKRLVVLALIALLTFVACGRKPPPEPPSPPAVDTTPPTVAEEPPVAEKGPRPTERDSLLHARFELYSDTATRVDLRSLRRREAVIYSPDLLVGEWVRGTLHDRYDMSGHGRSWDTADDVRADEAHLFHWKMDSNLLRIVYPMEIGGVVPCEYLVTFADEETLVVKDPFGTSYMWERAAP